jgi:hypothetical protein
MIDRVALLEKLDKATDGAAAIAVSKGELRPAAQNLTLVGKTFIRKNKTGLYDVTTLGVEPLYTDISVFDVAIILAQRYSEGDFGQIKQILTLESRFSKYHIDMLHYLHCIRGAKRRQDFEQMAILEDKFQVAEILARHIRDRISIFKKAKYI